MRVLMFGWEFPPHISGGLGTACYGLAKGLYQNETEILFVVPKTYGDENQEIAQLIGAGDINIKKKRLHYKHEARDMDYIEVGSMLIPYMSSEDFAVRASKIVKEVSDVRETSIEGHFKFAGKYGTNLYQEVANYALVANQIAASHQFDVIHAHDWLTYDAGINAKRISGKPLIVHLHATEFDRSGKQVNTHVFNIEKRGMEAADRVITVSNLTKRVAIEKYGIDPQKIITVYNAVQPLENEKEVYPKHLDEKIVTFLGRITQQKGPEYFVEAAYKVLQKTDKVRFVMAGSGDMMPRMIRRVAELKMGTHFHFTGFLRGKDVDRMFSMSDVYVMPSVSEPFGISPLEAMRSNVPVIISKQSGVSEILRYAVKTDFWDIDAMADAIYSLLYYNGLSEMFRKYGRKEVDGLKWENSAQEIKEIYHALVA